MRTRGVENYIVGIKKDKKKQNIKTPTANYKK